MLNFRTAIILVALSVGVSQSTSATPLTISNVTGNWLNGAPAGNVIVTNNPGQATDVAQWGDPADPPLSGYDMTPTSGSIQPIPGVPFVLATFVHHNNPIDLAFTITGIDYALSFDINGSPSTISSTFHFDHFETPNFEPCPTDSGNNPCDDLVTITNGIVNVPITVGIDQYAFNLLGFSNDGGATILTQFASPEGGQNSAQLYAVVGAPREPIVPSPVPEPTSMILLGTGLATAGLRRYRSRHNDSSAGK